MSIQHTELPWKVEAVGPHQDEVVNDETGFSIARMSWAGPNSALSKDNAAFIVRCVNSHDALVAALQSMCIAQELSCHSKEAYEAARAALSLAKGA